MISLMRDVTASRIRILRQPGIERVEMTDWPSDRETACNKTCF